MSSNDPRFLTIEQTAEVLQVSDKTIRRLITVFRIPAVRVGDSLRVPAEWLKALQDDAMNQTRVASAQGAQA